MMIANDNIDSDPTVVLESKSYSSHNCKSHKILYHISKTSEPVKMEYTSAALHQPRFY